MKKKIFFMAMASISLWSCGGDNNVTPAAPVQKENINISLKMTKNQPKQVGNLKIFEKSFEGTIGVKDGGEVDIADFSLTPVSGSTENFVYKNFKSTLSFSFTSLTTDSLTKVTGSINYLLLKNGTKETGTILVVKLI